APTHLTPTDKSSMTEPKTAVLMNVAGRRLTAVRLHPARTADAATGNVLCRAEGRGFESHHPLQKLPEIDSCCLDWQRVSSESQKLPDLRRLRPRRVNLDLSGSTFRSRASSGTDDVARRVGRTVALRRVDPGRNRPSCRHIPGFGLAVDSLPISRERVWSQRRNPSSRRQPPDRPEGDRPRSCPVRSS